MKKLRTLNDVINDINEIHLCEEFILKLNERIEAIEQQKELYEIVNLYYEKQNLDDDIFGFSSFENFIFDIFGKNAFLKDANFTYFLYQLNGEWEVLGHTKM